MRTLIFSALSLLLSYLAFYQNCEAAEGDVYNFYFQKAPGPQTVIQGAPPSEKSLVVTENATAAPAQAAQPAPPASLARVEEKPVEKSADHLKWAIRYGRGIRNYADKWASRWPNGLDRHFDATSLGGSYSLNKYVALDLELLFIKDEMGQETSMPLEPPGVVPYVALQLTPFRLTLFSYDLMDFSFLVGLTENPDFRASRDKVSTFTAFRYALNITSNFAIDARLRMTSADTSEYSSNLTWRF